MNPGVRFLTEFGVNPLKQMRIIQWNGAKRWAGAEVRLVEVCRHLANRGHSILAVARNDGPLLQHLKRSDVPACGLAPHGPVDLPRILRVAWLARRQRIQLIHAHAGRDYVPAILASRLAGCPIILHRHLMLPMNSLSRCFVSRFAHAVIAVSTPVQETLLEIDRLPSSKVYRIPMLVDPARIACSPAESQRIRRDLDALDKALIVSVGHLYASKGHEDLIAAVAVLRDQGKDFILAIAGEGPQQAHLESLIRESGLSAVVRLLGPREDVPALLAACDCFALLSWQDPFPGAVLEAMAAGKPVVACAAGGVPEMVRHGETGFLVPPHSAEEAARALGCLFEDADTRRRLGENAARVASTQFSFEHMLDRWLAVYTEVLDRP